MKLIAMKCPCCNGELNVDGDREFCFCQYCGTKIMIDDEIKKAKGMALTSRTLEVDNLLKRAKRFESMGNEEQALEYYDKVLDVDADNEEAIASIERIRTTVTDINLFIKYERTTRWTPKVHLYVDGEYVGEMSRGDVKGFVCPVGSHTIRLMMDEIDIKAGYYVPDKYVEGSLTFGFWDFRGLMAVPGGGVRVITKNRKLDNVPIIGGDTSDTYQPSGETKNGSGCFTKIGIAFVVLVILALIGSCSS